MLLDILYAASLIAVAILVLVLFLALVFSAVDTDPDE